MTSVGTIPIAVKSRNQGIGAYLTCSLICLHTTVF